MEAQLTPKALVSELLSAIYYDTLQTFSTVLLTLVLDSGATIYARSTVESFTRKMLSNLYGVSPLTICHMGPASQDLAARPVHAPNTIPPITCNPNPRYLLTVFVVW